MISAKAGITPQEISAKILREYGPVEKIILFGSAARGEADAASDIDLIIVKRTSDSFVRRLVNAPYFDVPADIFVYTPEEFEAMRMHENSFIENALQYGIVLYDRTKVSP